VTNKAYLLLCGRDYNQAHGAVDLLNEAITNMGDCIDLCAQQSGCIGAGWGDYQGTYTCWLKSALGTPNPSSAWYFVVEDDSAYS
jgi:hypothetical protein